jgi:hypothetical protein
MVRRSTTLAEAQSAFTGKTTRISGWWFGT